MAEDKMKLSVKMDVNRAIRDPLFWVDMFLSKVTFGRVDIGRWKRYVKVDPNG